MRGIPAAVHTGNSEAPHALVNIAKWMSVLVDGGYGFESFYYYDQGSAEYLTMTDIANGSHLRLHALSGSGGGHAAGVWLPDLVSPSADSHPELGFLVGAGEGV